MTVYTNNSSRCVSLTPCNSIIISNTLSCAHISLITIKKITSIDLVCFHRSASVLTCELCKFCIYKHILKH